MRIRFLRLSAVVALTAAVATMGMAWAAPQDRAPRIVTHRWVQQFGMVSPAQGQTLRLHVVHLGVSYPPDPGTPTEVPPPDADLPPDPCRVVLAFFDSQGRMIGNPDLRPLEIGKATFKDLNFVRTEDNGFPPDPCRATVLILQDVKRGQTPPDPCRASLELLDTASGRTSVHMLPAVQHALPALQR